MYSSRALVGCKPCSCSKTGSHRVLLPALSSKPAISAAAHPIHSHRISKSERQLQLSSNGFPQQRRVAASASADSMAMPMPDNTNTSEDSFSNVLYYLRGALFNIMCFVVAVPALVIMTVCTPFVLLFDRYRRLIQHSLNNIWAKISSKLFFDVQILGKENLPDPKTAAVYIANHQSFLDIFSLFFLDRPFKFISKASIFYIPIIGWSMFLTGHVMLNRMDRRSQLACLQQCGDLLRNGASVLFFPEGTRSTDLKLQEFKKGAFSVAVKAGVPVVPISITGTGNMMASGKELMLKPGSVKIVIHPPIPCKGRNADEVCKEARQAVASGLPAELVT